MSPAKQIVQKGKHLAGRVRALRELNWDAILTTTCCLLFGLVVVLLHKKMYEVMMHRNAYQLRFDRFQAATFPDWAQGRVKKDIRDQLKKGPSLSVYDPKFLKKLTGRYERSPWVRRVRDVERRGLRDVRVTLELRRPVAVVRDKHGRKYLVDRKGVRLPGVYNRIPERFGSLYRIDGHVMRVPESGRPWSSFRMDAAASVAGYLHRSRVHEFLRVKQLEVNGSEQDWNQGKGQIVIRTGGNKPVVWGGTEHRSTPWEPSPETKLNNLRRVLKGAPELQGLTRVKLQFSDPIVSLK